MLNIRVWGTHEPVNMFHLNRTHVHELTIYPVRTCVGFRTLSKKGFLVPNSLGVSRSPILSRTGIQVVPISALPNSPAHYPHTLSEWKGKSYPIQTSYTKQCGTNQIKTTGHKFNVSSTFPSIWLDSHQFVQKSSMFSFSATWVEIGQAC